jgi:hypothetical protein
MSSIVEKELVHAPLSAADSLLQAFLATHRSPEDAGARVVLHAGDVARAAIVRLEAAHRPEDMTPRYRVHWEAPEAGPYPVYDGELLIGADNDYDAFWLRLDGAYTPPGGIAGQVFDAVAGHRIASAVARNLLTEMRVAIEMLFADQERAKRLSP